MIVMLDNVVSTVIYTYLAGLRRTLEVWRANRDAMGRPGTGCGFNFGSIPGNCTLIVVARPFHIRWIFYIGPSIEQAHHQIGQLSRPRKIPGTRSCSRSAIGFSAHKQLKLCMNPGPLSGQRSCKTYQYPRSLILIVS